MILSLKNIIFFVCIIGLVIYLFKPKEQIYDTSTLIIATSLDYPPFEFIDQKTQLPTGFDIDVITEIATRLNKKLVIKNMEFSALVFSILTNQVDIVIAGLEATPQRAKVVTFSDPYLFGKPMCILSKTPIQSISDLNNKTVAVPIGHAADLYMANYPNINMVRLNSTTDCFMALQANSADAFVSTTTIIADILNKQNYNNFYTYNIPETGETCSMIVSKADENLLKEINTMINQMHSDGTIKNLEKKWMHS